MGKFQQSDMEMESVIYSQICICQSGICSPSFLQGTNNAVLLTFLSAMMETENAVKYRELNKRILFSNWED
jgi:hypothetical protein